MSEITLPPLGETVEDGTITGWLKDVGDQVTKDEPLFSVETDKVETEVPSPVSGALTEILVEVGETVPIGAVLARVDGPETSPAAPPGRAKETETPAVAATDDLGTEPEAPDGHPDSDSPATNNGSSVPGPGPTAPPPPQAGSVRLAPRTDPRLASPLVRRLLAEYDIDPALVHGTGRGGRITRDDVLRLVAFVAERSGHTTAPPAPTPASVPAAAPSRSESRVAGPDTDRVPFSRVRQRTAEHMVRSLATAAHVMTATEVDYQAVANIRERHSAAFREREGFSLTYLPFIARAVVQALQTYPHLNATVGDGELLVHRRIHLGIAVDLDHKGLVVPVVRDAEDLRVAALARAINTLGERARNGELGPDDLGGSTFTITNPGGAGTSAGAPIINQPEVGILSTEGIKKKPVVVERTGEPDTIGIHRVGTLSLCWDHRAFDGAYAGAFLAAIRTSLETTDWEQELV